VRHLKHVHEFLPGLGIFMATMLWQPCLANSGYSAKNEKINLNETFARVRCAKKIEIRTLVITKLSQGLSIKN